MPFPVRVASVLTRRAAMMHLAWGAFLAALCAASIFGSSRAAGAGETDENAFRVLTWNIRYDNPADGPNAWPRRKDWVAEIIESNKVEIAGLQEVLAGQLDDLKARLPAMDHYGVGRDDGQKRGEFAPILFRKDRFELLEKSTFWLSPTPEKPGSKGWDAAITRIASWVKLRDRRSGAEFYVVNTHFDHRGARAQAESAALLLKSLQTQFSDLPVILTGDLNSTPKSAPYNTLIGPKDPRGRVFLDAYEHSLARPVGPNSTWNGFEAIVPGRRIDYIFTTLGVRALRLRTLDDQREGRFPSDHLPVLADLQVPAAQPKPEAAPKAPLKELILPGESFSVQGRPAFVLLPAEDKRHKPQPWIFYAPTLPGYPDSHEKWMHEQFLASGVAVAGIDAGEAYGSPKGREAFSALYRELVENRGFAAKPCLLGRSRGGLWVTSWAAQNPDKVAGLAGIYPVFDLRTYPGLERAAPAYGLSPFDLEKTLAEHNPIERVSKLARAKIPAIFIHGDEDKVVPLKENSAEFVARYEAENAKELATLLVVKGQGHNFWEGFFRSRELIEFAIVRAKAGAEKEVK